MSVKPYKVPTNLVIYRGSDYPQTLWVGADLTGYTAVAECRETKSRLSPLICNLNAAIGAYDPVTNLTPVNIFVNRSVTIGITKSSGHWSLVLINPGDIAEPYVFGEISFLDDPSGAVSDMA